MVEIQKKLGITVEKQLDGIIGSATMRASEDKSKGQERAEAEKLIANFD